MEEEKLSYSLDVKLPKENLRNACKMFKHRLPRKRKKRDKCALAKQLGQKTNKLRFNNQTKWKTKWEYVEPIVEHYEKNIKNIWDKYIEDALRPFKLNQ